MKQPHKRLRARPKQVAQLQGSTLGDHRRDIGKAIKLTVGDLEKRLKLKDARIKELEVELAALQELAEAWKPRGYE